MHFNLFRVINGFDLLITKNNNHILWTPLKLRYFCGLSFSCSKIVVRRVQFWVEDVQTLFANEMWLHDEIEKCQMTSFHIH